MPCERPVFVVGAPRSGTTLLRYALSVHPHLYIPPESNFLLRFFHDDPGESLTRPRAVHLCAAVLGYRKFFKDWQEPDLPDPEAFVDSLPNLRPPTLIDALYSRYARQYGAARWGDKSPIYTTWMDELARLFPRAQFLHIVRDGRDVALSMQKAYTGRRFFFMNLGFAAHSWMRRVRTARASGARLAPDCYFELRYEALVSRPEELLQDLCGFLGEPYLPEMTEPYRLAGQHHHSQGIYATTRSPITTGRIGRWRQEMDGGDQRLFQAIAGDLLEELGYDVPAVDSLTLGDRARLTRLQLGYAAVESGRMLLQAGGVVHPAQLLSRR